MRPLRRLLVLLPLAGLLAACNIVIQLPFPVTPTPVSAVGPSSGSSPVDSFTLAPSEVVYYEVDVSASLQTSYDVLQVMAQGDQPLNLTFYGASGGAISSSSSASYFASGKLGLASLAATSVTPQGLAVNRTCAGPCIIQKLTSSTYYVRVENRSSSATASVQLYAFARAYDDQNEPNNNVWGGAVLLPFSAGGDSGAIETLGDADYWVMATSGTLYFDSSSAAQLRADVYDSGGTKWTTLAPGQTYSVQTGDHVKVYALNDERAGVSNASIYFVTLQ